MPKDQLIPHQSGRSRQYPPTAAYLPAAWVNALPIFVLAALPIVVVVCASV